ncbi:squalene/phytoene synthase family protein [endosymbiont of unidentified scaly snail isolate Monju]|uniref:squalene/phytoene synthase family protein n=1 Tax=endosymbiont of unidentified scaly snail isolate Monju TaxID=1248727 RepID=UPI0003892871|nr:squalene/phytoene synthase family protein [endosymbiont of unidentified scaly snail isolate Monju]BAN69216.1 phytoene synthase [endosymbiont of unidentified scaly snail isolate Monju]
MNADWHFPNAATPPGSAAYYLVRFARADERNHLAAWLAWFDLLENMVRRASDPGVTRLKLDWWREEIERLAHGEVQHPLSRVLAPWTRSSDCRPLMLRALDATEQRIMQRAPDNLEDFHRQCRDEQASRLYLLAGSTKETPAIEALGCYLGTVARLQRLGEDLQRHHRTLPHEFAIPGIEQLLQDRRLGTPGISLLQAAEDGLDREAALDYPLRALLAQHRRTARLLRRHDFPTDRLLHPSPLGLLWDAWRASHQP